MLTAFQPPRGHKNRHLGIQSILSPASPERTAGAFPQCRNHRAFGVFAVPKAGAERAALPVLRGAPDAGGISAARTVGRFSAESRHRSRVPSLIKAPVSSPFRVGFLPENVPRCFESLVSLAPCRVSHTGREWRFTLSGFSFNPWFDFPSGGRAVFSVSAGGNHGRKCVPEALRSHCAHRLFASCAAAVGRSHSMTAPEFSQTMYTLISRFSRSAHRPWRVP